MCDHTIKIKQNQHFFPLFVCDVDGKQISCRFNGQKSLQFILRKENGAEEELNEMCMHKNLNEHFVVCKQWKQNEIGFGILKNGSESIE